MFPTGIDVTSSAPLAPQPSTVAKLSDSTGSRGLRSHQKQQQQPCPSDTSAASLVEKSGVAKQKKKTSKSRNGE